MIYNHGPLPSGQGGGAGILVHYQGGWLVIDETTILRFLYVLFVLPLALYACGTFFLLFLFVRHRRTRPELPAVRDEQLPRVTVQLPLYNERYVARRIIDAVASLDYPCDRLHIQVLDDSTDDTTELIQKRIAQWQAAGLRIDLIRRKDRTGYKAGALAYGLARTDGEFIAIFDADFIPPVDFLRKTVPYFLIHKKLAVVQTRWGHLNELDNLLTRSQSIAIDAHFAVEQFTRSASRIPFSFNGTGGVWRREAIKDAGGWQHDTLTEDFDLSYRAHMRGWRFLYLRDVVVPGEVPPQLVAYKQQQARWAKGSTQVLRKLFRALWRSQLSLRNRLMGMMQLFQYVVQPVTLGLFLLTPWMLLAHGLEGLPLWPLGVLSLCAPVLYILGQGILYKDWWQRILYFPFLVVISTGMAVNNSRAVLAAFSRKPSEFKRTPKFRLAGPNGKSSDWQRSQYALLADSNTLWEIAFGLYALYGIYLSTEAAPQMVPYFVLYAFGFFGVAAWSSAERWWLTQPAGEGKLFIERSGSGD